MFQSTPVITDGRTQMQLTMFELDAVFQSTPVITDGRTLGSPCGPGWIGSFNPRPSSLTGERTAAAVCSI